MQKQYSQREGFVCLFCPRERPIDNQATSSLGLILPIGPEFFGFLPGEKVRETGFEFRPADRKHPSAVPEGEGGGTASPAPAARRAPIQLSLPPQLIGAPSPPPPARRRSSPSPAGPAPLPRLPALPGDPASPDAVASCSHEPGTLGALRGARVRPERVFRGGGCCQHREPLPAAVTLAAGRPGNSGVRRGVRRTSGQPTGLALSPSRAVLLPQLLLPRLQEEGRGRSVWPPASQEQRRFGMRGCSGAPNPLPRARDPATWTRGLM